MKGGHGEGQGGRASGYRSNTAVVDNEFERQVIMGDGMITGNEAPRGWHTAKEGGHHLALLSDFNDAFFCQGSCDISCCLHRKVDRGSHPLYVCRREASCKLQSAEDTADAAYMTACTCKVMIWTALIPY